MAAEAQVDFEAHNAEVREVWARTPRTCAETPRTCSGRYAMS
jgi:hypothetical protein